MASDLKGRFYLLAVLVLILSAVISYSNAMTGDFQFDDLSILLRISSAEEGSKGLLDYALFIGKTGRPVTDITFTLNYWMGDRNETSFHITNFVVHVLCSLAVFYLIRITLLSRALLPEINERANLAAFIGAGFFLVHPMQTQAVSYISQRYESLAALFYMSAIIFYVKGAESDKRTSAIAFYMLFIVTAVLGLGSKETAITLPVMVLVYDYYFLDHKHFVKRAALPAAIILLSLAEGISLLIRGSSPTTTAGFGLAFFTPKEYLLTEFRALALYIRLLFFPVNQNIDHDLSLSRSLFEANTAISMLFILTLFLSSLFMYRRNKIVSFFILWFFIMLAPTSSIVPIADPVFEHRVYPASLGVFAITAYFISMAVTTWGGYHRKTALAAVVAIMAFFVLFTYERNSVWATNTALWEDVAAKSPLKARGHYNLANAYAENGTMPQAIEHYKKAIEINPGKSNAYNNLANAYVSYGMLADAEKSYKSAIRADADNYEAYFNLGVILSRTENYKEAAEYFELFISKAPQSMSKQKASARKRLDDIYTKLADNM